MDERRARQIPGTKSGLVQLQERKGTEASERDTSVSTIGLIYWPPIWNHAGECHYSQQMSLPESTSAAFLLNYSATVQRHNCYFAQRGQAVCFNWGLFKQPMKGKMWLQPLCFLVLLFAQHLTGCIAAVYSSALKICMHPKSIVNSSSTWFLQDPHLFRHVFHPQCSHFLGGFCSNPDGD